MGRHETLAVRRPHGSDQNSVVCLYVHLYLSPTPVPLWEVPTVLPMLTISTANRQRPDCKGPAAPHLTPEGRPLLHTTDTCLAPLSTPCKTPRNMSLVSCANAYP